MRIDLDRCRKAMEHLTVRGLPSTTARLALIEEAIKNIHEDPEGAMAGEFLGIKNYAGFGDQRADCGYGMCPRHGSIVFEIGRNRNGPKVPLGADEIYLLECVRDFGSCPNTKESTAHNYQSAEINLTVAIEQLSNYTILANGLELAIEKTDVETHTQEAQ